jgi:hypothetical protein
VCDADQVDVARSAGGGALLGAAGGVRGENKKERVVRNRLRGRGYSVLD